MRRLLVLATLLFALPAYAVEIEWTWSVNSGNASDYTGFGSVGYQYGIGRYEVTNAQYAEFLNAVAATDSYSLYNPNMGGSTHGGITQSGSPGSYTYGLKAGMGNKPVVFVSFWDSLRFANWLHNGQPTGSQDTTTTEDGAYTLDGYTGDDGSWIERNYGATIFLPSEDEWYKAAYFDGYSYFDYPAGTDTPTVCALPGPTPNTANCAWVVGSVTDVGSYAGSRSPTSTFDQGGNALEWNEAIIGLERGTRGGTWGGGDSSGLAAWYRASAIPTFEFRYTGFRVASVDWGWLPVPFMINNGLAPPTPENVIDYVAQFAGVYVRNVGCPPGWPAGDPDDPCPSPGDPTEVSLVDGGSVGWLNVSDA